MGECFGQRLHKVAARLFGADKIGDADRLIAQHPLDFDITDFVPLLFLCRCNPDRYSLCGLKADRVEQGLGTTGLARVYPFVQFVAGVIGPKDFTRFIRVPYRNAQAGGQASQ